MVNLQVVGRLDHSMSRRQAALHEHVVSYTAEVASLVLQID